MSAAAAHCTDNIIASGKIANQCMERGIDIPLCFFRAEPWLQRMAALCFPANCQLLLRTMGPMGYHHTTILTALGQGKPMPELLREYLPVAIFIAVCAGLGVALMASAMVIAIRRPNPEKLSAYECGFNAFDDARMKFDVRFYLVSILFIIFDLEVAFLFP